MEDRTCLSLIVRFSHIKKQHCLKLFFDKQRVKSIKPTVNQCFRILKKK